MNKKILIACLAALAFSTQASAVTFVDPQFDVTAIASTDGAPGFDSQSSPPSGTPVSASADSVGTTDVATAGAFGGPGLLTTSADVTAATGIASAVATSHFSGSFLNAAQMGLDIDFSTIDFMVGSGTAATSLFVSLTSDGATLFADFVAGPWSFSYNPTAGTMSLLDLTLSSEVSGGFPSDSGNASSFGQASFAVSAVPLPATWVLFLAGLGPVLCRRKQGGKRTPLAA